MNKTLALLLASVVWLGGCSGRTDDASQQETEELAIAAALAANEQVRLLTDSPSLKTGAADTAIITAVVTDDQNRVVADRTVEFSSDGGALQNIQATTNETGEANAQLSLAGDYRNRNITVTATMNGQSTSILVAAAGTALSMVAPETIILGETADLEFTLAAGNDQPIPNQLISFQSEAGNTFSQNSATTDANGVARVAVSTTAGADVITVVAVDGTVDQQFELNVVENVQAVVTPIRIRVISNESSIETGGNDIARITTLVTDENNRVISGKTVDFSSTGGVLQNISSVTNEAGQANAELSLQGDYRNQEITVTAQVDDEVGSVLVVTNGSSLAVSGPTALVSGNTAELEITLTGGNDQPIANEIISINSAAGNSLSADTVTTDAAGKAQVIVGSLAGSDTITVEALGTTVTKAHEIQVAADTLTIVEPVAPASYDALRVDTPELFSVLWQRNGVPVVGETLKFSITSGVVRVPGDAASEAASTLVVTDDAGVATIELISRAAGITTVAFTDANDADPFSQYDVNFVAVDIADIVIEATPASVATGNASTLLAKVTDAFGNPVSGVAVDFSSAYLSGGTLAPVSALTDSDGEARITFQAGDIPTSQDELIVTATAAVDGALATDPSVSASTNLTVTERQLNVIIGLAGTVSEADSDTRYRKAGLVQVTDGAGRPVPDATILVSMIPTSYTYGELNTYDSDKDGEDDVWALLDGFVCPTEDLNNNRILDITEDVNENGMLDPSDPGLLDADPVNAPTVIGGQITTDANGVGFFSMAYPQSNAWWFDVVITARVQALGVEGVAQYATGLPALASDVADIEARPPNKSSPYGFAPADPHNCTQFSVPR